MPEGPSVRKFQLLTSRFVGQVVTKVGGSSKKINAGDLNALRLQDSQVHGKNLFLAFTAAISPSGPSVEETVLQEEAASGSLQNTTNGSGMSVATDLLSASPRLVLYFESGGFLVFYNCQMHWCSPPVTDPTSDILSAEFHRGQALDALCTPRPVCYTLMDQRYFSGLGNIIKNEILYLAKIHPLTQGSLLVQSDLEHLLDCAIQFTSEWLQSKLQGKGLHLQIYQKEQCPLGHVVRKGALGPPDGWKRLTWWCPHCQPAMLSGDGDLTLDTE
ncbi:UNVERIFIED_CONTAM: hypothetical protein H355_010094 [Colinus virginianus]|nr:hypothetical protein H355_010094 [Colinus virginianus]